ncbi:ATP-dependent helicase [Blattabacterium cuenoti]|uniref:ATP-dependent helicase n=1 Tax=Blattabacterium cuenoti TaxID=1653831 RepID=UPI00163BC59E|nr:UvrD-helicase domain-containing protein [Blattabacterium cuenoti]
MEINFPNLNKIQKKIIKTIDGSILVIAGAGSGKTRVITYRIIHMINNLGIKPENILALTFTKKSSKEMKDRIYNIIQDKSIINKLTIGTFHSIFSKILRKESDFIKISSNYTIYDQKNSENIIKNILEDLNLDKLFKIKDILKIISNYKNNLFFSKKKINLKEPLKNIYDIYIKKCYISQSLDFDDILLYTNYLFYRFPNILEKYQNIFKYILIDEYQDTNLSQNNIIKFLYKKHKNIFAVGDDAQSIYTFRGANISNILNFHIEYPKSKIFYLEQNYRSTNYIVQAANNIISFNKSQIQKKTWTDNENGEKIRIYCASSDKEEAQYIVNSINIIIKYKQYKYKDFAVFYRTNYQSYIIEYVFKKNKIPYKIYGNISLDKRKEVRDLLSYLKIVINPNDQESLLRILKNKISNKKIINFLLKLTSKNNNIFNIINKIESYNEIKINSKKIKNIKNIFNIIEKLHLKIEEKNAYEIIKNIIHLILSQKKNSHDKNKLENNQLYHFFLQESKSNKNIHLSEFLQNFYFEEIEQKIKIDNKNTNDDKNNKVSLMTVHLSKGLEFYVTFITGLEENIFPSKSKMNLKNSLKQIEEERRLFYVAITRAKKITFLTYAKSRFIWGRKKINPPSRFIKEINKNLISFETKISDHINNFTHKKKSLKEINNQYNFNSNLNIFKKGYKVFHPKFGEGIILFLQKKNTIATIKFKQFGEKKILLSLNKLIVT